MIDAKGAGTFVVRLFINSETHLPMMVSWQGQAMPMRGMAGRGPGAPSPGAGSTPGRGAESTTGPPPPAPAASGRVGEAAVVPPAGAINGVAPSAAPPAPVEFRIYYADFRDVDGLKWPFRIRRATGPETTEETTFDRFRVNTKIDQRKFEVRK